MKVLLTIGYNHYLLPDDTGITTLIKTLSKAVECDDKTWVCKEPTIQLRDPVTVELKYVPNHTKFTRKDQPVTLDDTPPRASKKQRSLPAPILQLTHQPQ